MERAILSLFFLVAAARAAIASSCSWQVFYPPNRSAETNALGSIVAFSATDVWAAGSFNAQNGFARPQVLQFDGRVWSQRPAPSEVYSIGGMAGFSDSDLWIAGWSSNHGAGEKPATLHWDGKHWTAVPNPAQDQYGSLFSVTEVGSPYVWAAGWTQGPVHDQPLIEHFDGTQWVVDNTYAPPNGSVLSAIAGTSLRNLWAGGYGSSNGAFIEHREPMRNEWVQSPNNIGLYIDSMSARSPNEVWAVGPPNVGGLFVERWDGRQWNNVQYPRGGQAVLRTVNATSSTGYTWFEGDYDNAPMQAAFIDRYRNGHWQDTHIVDVGSWQTNVPGLASVPGTSDLWAVGHYGNDTNTSLNLAERWTCLAGAQ